MKQRREKVKKRIKKHLKKVTEIGFVDSPFLKGIVSMIPLLFLVIMGGLVLKNKDGERILVLKTGAQPELSENHFRLAEEAAKQGDYQLAEKEYLKGLVLAEEEGQGVVLGVSSYLEDLIWPERKIRREIERLLELKTKVKSREVHLRLAELYTQLNEEEKAAVEILEAEAIDPNNEQVRELVERY